VSLQRQSSTARGARSDVRARVLPARSDRTYHSGWLHLADFLVAADFGFLSLVCLLQVALTAILWGCGTAVGEVPPYFLSYKAASAGRKNDAYQEIEQAMQQGAAGMTALLTRRCRGSRASSHQPICAAICHVGRLMCGS
jgi:hypothetical protein